MRPAKGKSQKVELPLNGDAGEEAVVSLDKKFGSRDKIGRMSELFAMAACGAGGGALASALGSSVVTVFGVPLSVAGVAVVAAASAPVVIGGVIAGAASGFVLAKLSRSGGRADHVREKLRRVWRGNVDGVPVRQSTEGDLLRLKDAMVGAVARGILDEGHAVRMQTVCREGVRPVDWAFSWIDKMENKKGIDPRHY